jgi:predicted O-methyltransferase YrrM
VLMAAIKLKIFDYLTKPKTANEISNALDSHEINTELFLNALAALGLIEKRNGVYYNTDIGKKFLVSGNDCYMGEFISSLTSTWHVVTLKELMSLIQNGPSGQMNVVSEAIWERNTRNSVNYQRMELAQIASQIISSLPEYPNLKKMLDLGGGAGMVAINIANNHPNIEGAVFDQPAVAKVTKEFIEQYQLDKRIQALSGNYMKDDIGSGYDLIWASFTFNFHQHELEVIIRKIYDSLNEGGVFIYFGDGVKYEATYPEEPIIGMLKACMMAATPLNMPHGKIAQNMLDCGFRSVRSMPIIGSFGESDVDIARK